MLEQKLDTVVLDKLNLPIREINLDKWKNFLNKVEKPVDEVAIGLVGKYTELPDAYKSIVESFIHAGSAHSTKVNLQYIDSTKITHENVADKLKGLNGILVAPGFGDRGVEGKITAVQYARENKIPFFGICLGMQCCVIEFARNVLGLKDATSTEFVYDTKHPVISLMDEQKEITNMGGTMRLGAYPCTVSEDSQAYAAYGSTNVSERHRHRYELNNHYLDQFVKAGLIPTGINPQSSLVEIVEIKDHPWFVGVQFHPEYKSTVVNPHPLFVAFVEAALKDKQTRKQA